ncbi:hypothetical protein P879_03689 [Paragonimus westermani]|uniref:Uncharacterized protein n=1 Tax=Paragonimus westermani TaxID=34504 RepID=A0A8T0DRS0_9TREM|nr:hypothetical protein P879_03689 [Paragonimus westermani]
MLTSNSVSDQFFQTVLSSLDKSVSTDRGEEVREILCREDVCTLLNENLAEFVHWLCQSILKLHKRASDSVLSVLTDFLNILPLRFDVNECLLLLTAQLDLSRSTIASGYLLKPLSLCVIQSGFARFARVNPIFNKLSESIASIFDVDSAPCENEDLHWYLECVLSFYETVLSEYTFSQFRSHQDEFLSQHLLFLLARPFFVIECENNTRTLFCRMFKLLRLSEPGLFTQFLKSFRCLDDKRSVTIRTSIPLCLLGPAWLRILSYVFLEATPEDLQNTWPLVFSKDHFINLAHGLLITVLDIENRLKFTEAEQTITANCTALRPLSCAMYTRVQIYGVNLLQKLSSFCGRPICSSWWIESRVLYLSLLKKLATQPISGENMPEIICTTIRVFDNFISDSTYSSQYVLFLRFLDPKQLNEHHGWRGHLITLCKDYVHSVWLQCMHTSMDTVCLQEKAYGETSVLLPVGKHLFSRLCELIFVYPLTASSDGMVDQSSWLLAALNMALYILLRCHALRTDKKADKLCRNLMDGLLRNCGTDSRFNQHFVQPLERDLTSEIDRYETRAHVLSSTLGTHCDHAEKKRLMGEYDVQQSALLRLRLLASTLERVNQTLRDL